MFLRNSWYVAAWDHEVTDKPFPTKLLGEEIVLFRKTDGTVGALEDACPHRKLPLSMGACTRVPGVEKIPHVARVQSYPIHERYGLLWVWMGAAEKANSDDIFHVENWGDPAWGLNRGDSMALDCNYLYMTDNLLDPSHVAWVHQGSFGNTAAEDTQLETTVGENGVTVWRWMLDVEPAPFYAPYLKFTGNCDRKQHYEVRYPGQAIIKAIFSPAGTGGEGKPLHPDTFLMDSFNFMTPVDENSTKYYWFQLRNFAPQDEKVSAEFARSVRGAFDEDRAVLTAVHKGMANMRTPNLNLKIDTGPLRFRWSLAKLIEAENQTLAAS
jgi:phenylpropionate dioxygenase-like ring-hydroxylating dioxygenase large terminal subunit